MSQSSVKSQPIANAYAFIAVCLFALFESELGNIARSIGIEAYIAFRLIFTGGFYFLVLWLFSLHKNGGSLVFSPRNVDIILYARGIFTVFYLACLAVAFHGEKSQALTYPFFFLHPIWQIVAARVISKKWPTLKKQAAPITMILIGVLIFAVNNPKNHDGTEEWWQKISDAAPSYVPALLAGIGFACTNEISSRISEKCVEHPYKFVGGVTVEYISGLRITAYTTYASILMLPITLPVMAIFTIKFEMSSLMLSSLQPEQLLNHARDLSQACLIIALGTWAITEAFARAKHTAPIAALDGLLMPLAVGFDLYYGKLKIGDLQSPILVGSLSLIVVGAIWSAFRPEAN